MDTTIPREHGAARVALVVGDTAGHTHPALALAEALRARAPNTTILFFGTSDSVAASIVERAGHPFVPVPGSAIRHADVAGLACAARLTLHAIGVARRTLRQHRSQFAMGFGSFASGGVILAARSLGLPAAILEANVEVGLANRWLRPWVTQTFQGLGPEFSPTVGVPVRASVAALHGAGRDAPRRSLRVLVASGSRGADFFAGRLPAALRLLVAHDIRVEVRQQAADTAPLRAQYAALGITAEVLPFLDDIAGAYAWADVAITRGGAGTIAELAIAGVPALVVPLSSASANHQAANARLWQQTGAGIAIDEDRWTDAAVAAWLLTMATDEGAWRACAHAARRLARPAAATHLAAAVLQLIRGRS